MYVQKSFVLKPAETDKKWHLVDADGMVVGRLATEVANILRGKNNPQYTPHTDSGDFVVVVNASKIKFTGNKWDKKKYYWHTGYIGALKERTAREQLERAPEKIVMDAVKGMMPKSALGKQQLKKLRVFAEGDHGHAAQKPEKCELN